MKIQLGYKLFLWMSLAVLVFAEPKCHTKEAIDCAYYVRDFLNTLPKGAMPETPEEIDGFCGALHQDLTCWEAFIGQCTTPIQRQLEALLSQGYKNFIKDFCDDAGSKRRKDYEKHVPCMNTVEKSDNNRRRMNYIMAVLDEMLGKPNEASLSVFCCGMNKMYAESRKDLENTCGAEVVSFMEDAISSIISTIPSAICGKFDPASDECKKVELPENSKPAGLAKNSEVYKFLVDLFSNYIPE